MKKNLLSGETSPYLLQHAENPVDWYPWGVQALDLARQEDKPILLSIGYSACHWCHVMAHESFEDQTTGALMNEYFVNIKVDREERPDIDRIYQTAQQLLTQRTGGWPLTMFLDPQTQRPFFGGTYFPDEARHGMPSFRELLIRISEYYESHREEIRAQGKQLAGVFERLDPPALDPANSLDDTLLSNARTKIAENFDREFGGFGGAPKFPHPATLERLLRDWRASADSDEVDIDALFMVSLTLTRMADGGIYDHVGGGFCRYSVDRYWQIPHFEKMLYDNGPLLALYANLFLATGDDRYGQVARETANWMIDDMLAPNGGFFSTRDADSEGEEGKFYVWTPDEVRQLIGDDVYTPFASRFGLDQEANFEGNWHLTARASIEDVAASTSLAPDVLSQTLEECRRKLFERRATRTHPARDEKQLTSWNALAIRGFAIAGRTLQEPQLTEIAVAAQQFVESELLVDGRLFASHKDGRTKFPAYLDDHAYLLDAALEVLQNRWDSDLLGFAQQLADLLLEHFYDQEQGGFFFTADDHEDLMHRPKPFADDATPSGNGVAVFALQRLGFLLGDTRYLDAAEKTLLAAYRAMEEYPHGHVSLLTALEEYLHHPEILILRGDEEIFRWRDAAARLYAPRRLVFAIAANTDDLPGALAERRAIDGETVAYRCTGTQCSLPMTSWEALSKELASAGQ